MSARTCFLCSPDRELVYHEDSRGIALCGLGPIVPGYSVVAPSQHLHSAADSVRVGDDGFLDLATDIRARLIERFGSCLLTEHGRIPVCTESTHRPDPHCFHAHFLLFPGVPAVEHTARAYFGRVATATDMREALQMVDDDEGYFFLSPNLSRFLVLTPPVLFIRQFSRLLVADAIGKAGLADWRKHPQLDRAKAMAAQLADQLFGSRPTCTRG